MFVQIIMCVIIATIIVYILNIIISYRYIHSIDLKTYYKNQKIKQILSNVNGIRILKSNRFTDKQLIQMLLEYSMQTDNYGPAMRNIDKITALSKSENVQLVAKRVKEVVEERCGLSS